jgi:hypothetical protein
MGGIMRKIIMIEANLKGKGWTLGAPKIDNKVGFRYRRFKTKW